MDIELSEGAEVQSDVPFVSTMSGPSSIYGVMQLAENARQEISEVRQKYDSGDSSEGTKGLLDALSMVDAHLDRIHNTAERMVLQNARSKT